jgi:4-hydroxythreonine-4-phosphate dehydrogenase
LYLAKICRTTYVNKQKLAMKNKIVVGITQGDSNGIGYEIIIKALSSSGILDVCTPVVYGSSKIMGYYKKLLKGYDSLSTHMIQSPSEAHHKRVNVINCVPESFVAEPGKKTGEGAKAAMISLEEAVKDLRSGDIDVLVTAPFDKALVSREGFEFTGHTEYLAKEFGSGESLMMMCSENMKVGLATNHLPISEVSPAISQELISGKLRLMISSLKRDFAVDRPKIAVLSLNPHNGDEGLTGEEEREIIKPVIKEFVSNEELVFGPFPADGFFASANKDKFDAILAMYHDQGLIPFKSFDMDRGVNFTAGLEVVRCSPDHGTAYDIAGKSRANHLSMLHAIYTACDIYNNRKIYDELSSNPLDSEIAEYSKDANGSRN